MKKKEKELLLRNFRIIKEYTEVQLKQIKKEIKNIERGGL